jgi:hypothetical protein
MTLAKASVAKMALIMVIYEMMSYSCVGINAHDYLFLIISL